MSWFQQNSPAIPERQHASPADIVACFEGQRALLEKLAFLITVDRTATDQALAKACDITLHGNGPFRDWLLEWAKTATIVSAISQQANAIRICQIAYKGQRCTHVEHLWQGDAEERAASLDLILDADAPQLIAELDPLCRAVLVLRVAVRSSIQDCALRLNVSRAAVLAANCHAMTWLDNRHAKPLQEFRSVTPVQEGSHGY